MTRLHARSAIALAASLALSGSLCAQAPQLHIYVDPNATTTFNGILPSFAFTSIDDAVNQAVAQFPLMQSGQVVTIHVAPGTYAESLQLPAHGIRIEPYGQGSMPTLIEPVVVDTPGDPALGATTLDRLHFHAGSDFGSLYQLQLTWDIGSAAVHVTGCRFTVDAPIAACLNINTKDDARVAHVVEGSTFVSSVDDAYIVAIWETCFAFQEVPYSSCLYRGNDITNFETSLYLIGCGDFEERMRPRILSNAMRLGERIVQVAYAQPRCVNNTVALFKDFGNAAGDEVWGISFEGCSDFVVANNIVWFEPSVGADLGDLANDLAGPIAAPSVVTHNHLSDTPGTSNPLVAGVGPQLSPASGLDNQGAVAWCLPPLSLPWAGGTVPADVAVDFEGDMRCREAGGVPYVAIGCDQLSAPRATLVQAAGVDGFANVLLGQSGGGASLPTLPFTVRTSGLPAGGAMLMTLSMLPPGFLFGGVAIDPLQQHLYVTPFGSVTTLPVAPLLLSTQAVGSISASGIDDVVFTLPPNAISAGLFDTQTQQRLGIKFYVQGFVLSPGGVAGVATNRLELGLALDPAQW